MKNKNSFYFKELSVPFYFQFHHLTQFMSYWAGARITFILPHKDGGKWSISSLVMFDYLLIDIQKTPTVAFKMGLLFVIICTHICIFFFLSKSSLFSWSMMVGLHSEVQQKSITLSNISHSNKDQQTSTTYILARYGLANLYGMDTLS